MHKYTKVVRMGHKSTRDYFKEGDYIYVQEKLDGANASFKVEDGKLKCFSRNLELSESERLRGFYDWVHKNIKLEELWEGVVYIGEWLCPHKVPYPEEAQYNFYLFDVFHEEENQYLPFNIVLDEADQLGLKTVPLFYEGVYKSYEQLMEYVGKTEMGGEFGEGIVVKKATDTTKFVKLVSEEFAELMPQAKSPKKPQPLSAESEFVRTFLNEARVEKMLYKLVDEGIIDEHFDLSDMGTILRELGNRIYEDIIEEEGDSLPEGFEEKMIKKGIGRALPVIVKTIIQKKSL